MAGVIKANRVEDDRSGVRSVAFNLDDVTSRAQAHLDEVKRQAARLLEQTRQQATEIQRQAEAAGRQAAMEAARQTVRQEFGREIATVVPALQQAVKSIRDAELAWRKHWEDFGLTLAIAIAERIVRRELSQDPQISKTWLREALELAGSGTRLRVLVNPQDFAVLEGNTTPLLQELGKVGQAEILPDPTVSRGGCRVLTEQGEIDQTLETQLKRLRDELAS